MSIPIYLTYYVLGGAVVTVIASLFGLRAAISKSDWPSSTKSRILTISSFVLVAWFVASVLLALMGVYQGATNRLPTIQYGIFIPILIGGLLIWRSPAVARLIDAIPQHWLVGVQVNRLMGVIFLVLYATGNAPGPFAWPAGLGDFLVGALAPIIAISYFRNPRENGDLVTAWNCLGLLDLTVAIITGFLTSASPLQAFSFDLPNRLIDVFPLVLIPTFLVPLCYLLHFASLAKLHRTENQKKELAASFMV